MNTGPATSASDLADFNHFYSGTHLAEVIAANPGFRAASRYELLAPDSRGDLAPRWLAVYELDSDTAVQTYLVRNDGPAEGRPKYTPGPAVWSSFQITWRMMWRQPGHVWHRKPAAVLDLHGRHERAGRYGRDRSG